MVTHAYNIPVAVKMVDSGKRFNLVYFNGRRILDFSNSRPKDKSEVRIQRQGRSTRPFVSNRAQDMPDDGGVSGVNIIVRNDEEEVDVQLLDDGVHDQPSWRHGRLVMFFRRISGLVWMAILFHLVDLSHRSSHIYVLTLLYF